MNFLKINKNNITSNELNQETGEFVEIDIKDLPFPFSRYFRQVVELAEDLTVEDLMNHINKNSELIDLCFYSYLDGISVKEYFDLMLTEPERKSFVDTIEMYWSTEIKEDEYCLFGCLHGIVKNTKELEGSEESSINSFKMDLTPINEWKHCKIYLDDEIKASASGDDGENYIIKLRNRWTLFNLLEYFLFEITYFGSVEDQKKEIEEFDTIQKKYDTFRTDPHFALKLNKNELDVFIKEIQESLEYNNESLKEAVDNDDFESAANLKKENDELKEELLKMLKRVNELN